MRPQTTPAFYSLAGAGTWKDYVNLLHLPYTLWHLSYTVLGAAIAPTLYLDRLGGTLLAFALALGIGCHALDELNSRPLGTRIPRKVLWALAIASLSTAVTMGAFAGMATSPWTFAFVAFGVFIAVAYNLGLWNNRFHSDFWFAFAWGAFPALTSYWVNVQSLSIGAVLLALGCFALSLAQRSLSTPVRTIRRKARTAAARLEMADGSVIRLDADGLVRAPERALRVLSMAVVVLAAALLVERM